MAEHLPNEMAGDDDAGPTVLRARSSQGNKQTIIRSFNLSEITIAQNDTVALGVIPKGARFAGGTICSAVSFGATATLAVGVSGTADKYKDAAVFTTVDQPVNFGNAAAMAAAETADQDVILTVAAAAAPTSDHDVVVTIEYLLG